MKKMTTKQILILLITLFAFNYNVIGQGLTYEIGLDEQVQNSTQIIEGKVISKTSYWDTNHQNIYTINTVEVYKVFKGQSYTTINIITPGGTVGLQAEKVTPSLGLHGNDIGVFLLHNDTVTLEGNTSTLPNYKAYSSLQGFYKYNITDNVAANLYNVKQGITDVFYNEITSLTNQDIVEVNELDIDVEAESRRGTILITSFSPTMITAGTKSIVTINGVGFGATPGTVGFKDTNNGGATFFTALDSEIVSWSDTEIMVEVPSRAGTGTIQVNSTSSGSTSTFSSITISYAQINVQSNFGSGILTAYQTQHVNDNFFGGYTWQMFTDFDNNTAAKTSFLRAFETWVCETGINWVNGTTTSTDSAVSDGINIIRFDNGNEFPAGVLGRNTSYFMGCDSGISVDWYISELDIVFDDGVNWEFGPATPAFNEFDFETVAVHELGHGHQLAHVIDPSKIMHFAIGNGQNNRILSQDDIDGANDVQNRSTTTAICGNALMTNSSCSLSVDDNFLADNILIYPNPAKNELNIKNPSFIDLEDITFYDLNGRLIFNRDISNTVTLRKIDVSSLSNGMYFITINSDRGTITKKIIIE